jgi:hypothetical protein
MGAGQVWRHAAREAPCCSSSLHLPPPADYKTRGTVILKGADTAELIERLEDSQMTLGSMATNRRAAGRHRCWSLPLLAGANCCHPPLQLSPACPRSPATPARAVGCALRAATTAALPGSR